MTAQSLILPAYDGAELRRWAFAAAFVVTAHVAAVGAYVLLPSDEDEGGSDLPAVFVDLTPIASSSPSLADLPPGQEAPEALPTPKPEEIKPEQVAEPIQKIETPSEVTLPAPVRAFLRSPLNRRRLVGIIGSGNRNFGAYYQAAARELAAASGRPVLFEFELSGTPEDVDVCARILDELDAALARRS